jgi:hypothetical protein
MALLFLSSAGQIIRQALEELQTGRAALAGPPQAP